MEKNLNFFLLQVILYCSVYGMKNQEAILAEVDQELQRREISRKEWLEAFNKRTVFGRIEPIWAIKNRLCARVRKKNMTFLKNFPAMILRKTYGPLTAYGWNPTLERPYLIELYEFEVPDAEGDHKEFIAYNSFTPNYYVIQNKDGSRYYVNHEQLIKPPKSDPEFQRVNSAGKVHTLSKVPSHLRKHIKPLNRGANFFLGERQNRYFIQAPAGYYVGCENLPLFKFIGINEVSSKNKVFFKTTDCCVFRKNDGTIYVYCWNWNKDGSSDYKLLYSIPVIRTDGPYCEKVFVSDDGGDEQYICFRNKDGKMYSWHHSTMLRAAQMDH